MKIIKKWLKSLDKKMEEKAKNSCNCCKGSCDDKPKPKKGKNK